MQLFVRCFAKNLHFVKYSLQNYHKSMQRENGFIQNHGIYTTYIYGAVGYDIPSMRLRCAPVAPPLRPRCASVAPPLRTYCKIVMPFWAQRVRSSEDHSLTWTSPIWCLCSRTIQSRDCPIPPPMVRGKVLVNTALW